MGCQDKVDQAHSHDHCQHQSMEVIHHVSVGAIDLSVITVRHIILIQHSLHSFVHRGRIPADGVSGHLYLAGLICS